MANQSMHNEYLLKPKRFLILKSPHLPAATLNISKRYTSFVKHEMKLDISLQKLHCRKHLTSHPLPLEKNFAVQDDLEKRLKNHWGAVAPSRPPVAAPLLRADPGG